MAVRRFAALVSAAGLVVLTCGTATAAPEVRLSSSPQAPLSQPAQSGVCSTVVGDAAHVMSAPDSDQLTESADNLSQRVILRVRTVSSVPRGDLDAYERVLQAHCHWIDGSAKRLPRLLVVMVSTTDRRMGIYVGSGLSGTITKPVWLSIEQGVMRPYFAKAAWAAGLRAGLAALDKDLQQSRPSASAAAASEPSAVASDPSPIESDAGDQLIQGDADSNGVVPGGSASSSSNGSQVIGVVAFMAIGGVIAGVLALSRGSSGRSRRHWDPGTSTWIDGGNAGGHHHGGWGGDSGGYSGGGDSGGGGGGDGGGSSGF